MVSVFVVAGLQMRTANKYSSAAPREVTAISSELTVSRRSFWNASDDDMLLRGFRPTYYQCSYQFSVGDNSYSGSELCPEPSAGTGKAAGSSDPREEFEGETATVYYDPLNPSVNSLIGLSAASEREFGIGIFFIGVGVIVILFMALGSVLNAIQNKERLAVAEAVRTMSDLGPVDQGAELAGSSHGESASSAGSSPFRELYLEVVKKIHPDHAANDADLALRERLMKEANAAFERGDTATLRSVLEDYRSATPTQ